MSKKEVVAMLLAGGQGSRLGILTKKLAKPALPFGGKYRIIDFTLSNCANSGISTVGVLTQYQPHTLNSYIGSGKPWDLDRQDGGVRVLPPYLKEQGGEWYKGTANAVYQNLDFIRRYQPEYVLILSGDHIYKMDYGELIEFHKQKKAAVSIAVIPVAWEETHRFGVLKTEEQGKITDFQEKPKKAESNLASMGVYLFNWGVLRHYLKSDAADLHSSNDFGKDIIPAMLRAQEAIYAYPFCGYWKDVGTIESLWEANMDLLKKDPKLVLNDPDWKILTVNHSLPPQLVAEGADVQASILSDGCLILGRVCRSVIFTGTAVDCGAEVVDSILMPGVKVKGGAQIHRAIIGENTLIGAAAQIGVEPAGENGRDLTVLEDNIEIPAGSQISRGTILSVSDWPEYPEERIS